MDYSPLHRAVSALAGVCDYANSEDARGFNGTDAHLGHALAAVGAASWTDDMALTAWDMTRKYAKTQLEPDFGIDWEDLPVPPGAAELADERRQQAREAARASVREHRDKQYRAARSFVICDGEDQDVVLSFPFDWTLVNEAKAITGRSYRESHQGHRKVNVYPFSSLPLVIDFADKHEIPVNPEVRILTEVAAIRHAEALKAAAEAAEARAALAHVRLDDKGRLILDKDWDNNTHRLNADLRALNMGRSTWDGAAKLHRLPHRNPEALQAVIDAHKLTVSPEAQEAIDGELDNQRATYAESWAETADPVEVRGLDESVTIKPQQFPVIRWILKRPRCFVGDDMGLGKSLSSLSAVAVADAYPLVIACKPDLVGNWVNELKRFPALNVFVAKGQKAQRVPDDTDVIVIGTSILGHSVAAGVGKRSYPWVDAIAAHRPKALILDESQIAKEWTAARTKALLTLSKPIIERDGMVLNLSGTAMMNRPKELASQLEIMGRIDEFGGTGAFLVRHCENEEKSNGFGRDFSGAKNLDELHYRLRAFGIMIRRKKDILGLPKCEEIAEGVDVSQLDPEVMAEYYAAERDVVRFLADKAAKIAKRFGVDPDDARVKAAMKAQSAEQLVMINTLRGLIGKAKLGYVTKWVSAQVAKGEKVMVAAHHKEITADLAKRFGGLKIVGGQTIESKEADKAKFQTDPAATVITVAVEAGGMGHTLTAARTGLLAELVWTPGGARQMRDRINRIGQTREMTFTTLVATGTIDDYMFEVVARKAADLDAVHDGKRAEGVSEDEGSAAAEVAWRLAMRGFGGRA